MNLLALFGELKRGSQPDVPKVLSDLSGGAKWDFVRRQGIEQALQRIGADLHGTIPGYVPNVEKTPRLVS